MAIGETSLDQISVVSDKAHLRPCPITNRAFDLDPLSQAIASECDCRTAVRPCRTGLAMRGIGIGVVFIGLPSSGNLIVKGGGDGDT
jgi:hypothetical protein